MTGKEFQYVLNTIENEGFEYTFEGYSFFEEIKDEMFHRLRKAFLDSRKALAKYIGFES